jgi:hypothetical protein
MPPVLHRATVPRTTNTNNNNKLLSLPHLLVLCVFIGGAGFYIGTSVGSSLCASSCDMTAAHCQELIAQQVRRVSSQKVHSANDMASRFPSNVHEFAVGMSVVSRDEFAQEFNMGVPLDESTPGNNQVLILYQSQASVPSDNAFAAVEATSQTELPKLATNEAVANCDYLNVILSDHNSKRRRQCFAIMGQYEAFHIQKHMRLPVGRGKLDPKVPLRFVNRGARSSGFISAKPPTAKIVAEYRTILINYLASLHQVLEKLKPIAASVAKQNTIIVMVCNFGQSELLLNFICSAQRRNLDLSAVLVFATDKETNDLVAGLGVAVFYNPESYGQMPKDAATLYADGRFRAMMMAKVFCVHQISSLGYDVLFQGKQLCVYMYVINEDACDKAIFH